MNNYIYTNSNILLNKINFLILNGTKKNKINECTFCNKQFNHKYIYTYNDKKITLLDERIHKLQFHNIIDIDFYKLICEFKIPNYNIDWCLLNTNGLNIIDGLFEIGSNQIYSEKNKSILKSKIIRFSEHSGFIYFENNKINNIVILNNSRVDNTDPLIYMPANCIEALKVDYIFHTHPKTPYIGSRIKNGIIYEFPSISDIIHFIEHHNNGKLLGSIVVAPEGVYIIRKNNFDRKLFKIDYDIMIENLENIFMECYNDSYNFYSDINYHKLMTNNEIKIPDNYFYQNIANNFEYIDKINKVLLNWDIFIDYYPRVLLNRSDIYVSQWIFPDIYIPIIN